MDKLVCSRCGHKWVARTQKPNECPTCKTRYWNSNEYKKCEVCGRNFIRIAIHHKDGNKKNNDKSNLIKLCLDCHLIVHTGLKNKHGKRTRLYKNKPAIIKKLEDLNGRWLILTGKLDLKDDELKEQILKGGNEDD